MMQWLQSLSQHYIRSHAPEITLTTLPCFPFYITVKHKFVHRTWKAAKGLIYTRPVLRRCCLPANLENKLKVIRMKGWKYRGRVKSWLCSVLIEARCFQSDPTAVCLAHITKHCCLPWNPLLSQSQAPSMPREPACCWGTQGLHFTHWHGLSMVQLLWMCHLHSSISQQKSERSSALCVLISGSGIMCRGTWSKSCDECKMISPLPSPFLSGLWADKAKKGGEKSFLLTPCLRWADRAWGTQDGSRAQCPPRLQASLPGGRYS